MVASDGGGCRHHLSLPPIGRSKRIQFDFVILMGCYIVAFFLVLQLLAVFTFHQPPSSRTLLGRTFIPGGFMIVI